MLLLRFLGVLRARPKHMITWGELKLAGLNGARAAWFRLRERRGGTHRHGNRVSVSSARCSQSKTLFPEATSYIKPKTLDPLSSDTTVQAAEGRKRCGTVEDARKHDGKALASQTRRGLRAVAARAAA